MDILGLASAGSVTAHRKDMARFAHDVLGLAPVPTSGGDADMSALPDSSRFAVVGER